MGAAAYYRASKALSVSIWAEHEERKRTENLMRSVLIMEECDEWRRQAWDFFVESCWDGKGLASNAIKQAKKKNSRSYQARMKNVRNAHSKWIDTHPHHYYELSQNSIDYAKAVYQLLKYCSGAYHCEMLDQAPRVCTYK